MKKNRLSHKLFSEYNKPELSHYPQGHYSLKLEDGCSTPVCVIPIPLGGEKTGEGKSAYVEAVKDEIMKRWNSRQSPTKNDIERAKYTAVNDFKISLRVKYAKEIDLLEETFPNGLFTKENDGELVGVNVLLKKIICEMLENQNSR
ncbi:MAG: hypothetical protein Q8J76_01415 [Desulfobulbaceae bacterium]|nr:hypothetical protein [Desulfobulbaceae bacterium]